MNCDNCRLPVDGRAVLVDTGLMDVNGDDLIERWCSDCVDQGLRTGSTGGGRFLTNTVR